VNRIAALDVGDRRIGYAVADPTGTIVSHTGTLVRSGDGERDLGDVAGLVREYSVEKLVVGHPVHLSGEAGAQAQAVDAFVEGLAAHLAQAALRCEIVLWDERLTSVMAERYIRGREDGRSRSRRKPPEKGRVDAVAAALILESYLQRSDAVEW
jgi:putative Holliday junction resolvase